MIRRAALVVALAACARPAAAPQKMEAHVMDLSAELEPIRVKGKLPALAAAAFRGDEVLAIGATGFRRQGHDERVTVDDKWHLGSDTKAMTAVLVAIWIDRGKLRFDETLGEIFGSGVSAGFAPVTIEQLLRQRGGFSGAPSPERLLAMWAAGEDRAGFVAKILAEPTAHEPGKFEYANESYIVLGAALERVSGKSWETLAASDLFAPLGMRSCGFGAPEHDAPWGHREIGGEIVPVAPGLQADNPPVLGPAGRVHCSLRDWGKFLAVVLAGARGEKTIASAATMKRLLTPPEDARENERYAGGWMETTRPWGGKVLTHSGSNTMWMVTAWLAPEKNLSFVAATNVFAPKILDGAFATTIPRFTAPASRE